jgi:hypothetical protein
MEEYRHHVSAEETAIARKIIGATVGEFKDMANPL